MQLPQDLGNGLRMRAARPEDAGRLVACARRVDGGEGRWSRELVERARPAGSPGGNFLVEDTRTGAVVSYVLCLAQTWSYGGVTFGVGQIASVGTDPSYRRRGLVRAQMEAAHAWSARRGHLAQVISGIPYFYRQFGYEYALEAAECRVGDKALVPPRVGPEPYRVRFAKETDLPFLARVYAHAMRRYAVTLVRRPADWRRELGGRSCKSGDEVRLEIIETAAGEPAGFLRRDTGLDDGRLGLLAYELKPGVSWLAATPSVVRHLCRVGEKLAAKTGKRFGFLALWLGAAHPAYRAASDCLPDSYPPSAHYLRVPDLPAFLRRVTPALEERLAGSVAVGHTGELQVSFYRTGLRLVLERGKVTRVEPLEDLSGASARFPDLTFTQLLFGYRALGELKEAYPDCRTRTHEAWVLLNVLFPKWPPGVWHMA